MGQNISRAKCTQSEITRCCHWKEFGVDCLLPLRGMFVFAIWDGKNKRLFVARDRVGKKPLYYTLTDDSTFIFGSELKSLLQHPKTRRVINPEAVDAYLTCGYVPD